MTETDEQLNSSKEAVIRNIQEWAKVEKKRLKNRFEKDYADQLAKVQNEMETRIQSEFQQIQTYFSNFSKEKEAVLNSFLFMEYFFSG